MDKYWNTATAVTVLIVLTVFFIVKDMIAPTAVYSVGTDGKVSETPAYVLGRAKKASK